MGNITLGNGKVYIESMLKVKTSFYKKALIQAKKLQKQGCEILRLAVKDEEDVKCLSKIKSHLNIPLIADVHYNPKLALQSLEVVECVRINPLNIVRANYIKQIGKKAKELKKVLRIGVNSGSLRNTSLDVKKIFLKRILWAIKILEKINFFDIMISAKSRSVIETVSVNRLIHSKVPYPLHIGVTASGPGLGGVIKSSIGVGSLLLEGIGDTIRISLTDTPFKEVLVSKYILQTVEKRRFFYDLISCPGCGRADSNFLKMVKKAERILQKANLQSPLSIAIMGCEVNGPGEAKSADVGFAFGGNFVAYFEKGKVKFKIRKEKFWEYLSKIGERNVLE